jgi:hypothetical protein
VRANSRSLLALLAGFTLAGCTLIDQNTFNPHAGDAPVIPPAPKPVAAVPQVGPPPLLVIPPGSTGYAAPLQQAVAAARARKPGVLFDVVEMQPSDRVMDAPLGADAAAVARLIVAQGVPAANVRLAARPERDAKAGEVRVFVR